jgi:hypothetical protein
MDNVAEPATRLDTRNPLSKWVAEMQSVVGMVSSLLEESERHRAIAESAQREHGELRESWVGCAPIWIASAASWNVSGRPPRRLSRSVTSFGQRSLPSMRTTSAFVASRWRPGSRRPSCSGR